MRAVLLVATLTVLAGCVTLPAAQDLEPAAAEAALLRVDANVCRFAGSVTQIPFGTTVSPPDFAAPEPFVPADTTRFTNLPAPASGAVYGNAHIAFSCWSWLVGDAAGVAPNGGFLGLVVEPPALGTKERAAMNILASAFATPEAGVIEALTTAGVHAPRGSGSISSIDDSDVWAVRAELAADGPGRFVTYGTFERVQETWPVLRVWFVIDAADGRHVPAYLDFVTTDPVVGFGQAFFSHTETTAHAPVGRFDGPTGGFLLDVTGFEASFHVLDDEVSGGYAH